MTRDPQRAYRIARAVWLYDLLQRAIDRGRRAQISALTDRVIRALRNMEAEDQHQYYCQIAGRRADRVPEARQQARAQLSREAGARVAASLTPEELADRSAYDD